MIKLLILSVMVISLYKADCLTNDNLVKLGLTPLDAP